MNTHMQGTFAPEAVQPDLDHDRRLMPLEPNHRWTLGSYGDWQWDFKAKRPDGSPGRWTPTLKQIRHTPGANGVGEVNKRAQPNAAFTGFTGNGGIVIHPNDARLGRFRGYLGRIACRHPSNGSTGWRFVYRWTSVALTRNGRRGRIVLNQDEHAAFLDHLVRAGIVPPMPREVVEEQIGRLDARVNSIRESRLNRGNFTQEAFDEYNKNIENEKAAMWAAFRYLRDLGLTEDAQELQEIVNATMEAPDITNSIDIVDDEEVPTEVAPDVDSVPAPDRIKPKRGRPRKTPPTGDA